jgi:inorganic pyrophosphatase
MDVSKIPAGHAPPLDINVIVEIAQGGNPVKYELGKESGAVFVDRFLHTAMFYPGNYGFVPHTLTTIWGTVGGIRECKPVKEVAGPPTIGSHLYWQRIGELADVREQQR